MRIGEIIKSLVPASVARMKRLENKIDVFRKDLSASNVFWNCDEEREMVKGNYGDVMADADFELKFSRLISGLDADSVNTIIRIIIRQHKYMNCDDTMLDLFTEAEKQQIKRLRDDFYSVIMKVSDNLYAYRNYLLPLNHFEASVFYYKHGVDSIKTINKVKGHTIIDVGGFVGDSALVLSELMPNVIYSFEPIQRNFQNMLKTISLNKLENVIPVNFGLGNQTTLVDMYVSTGGGGSSFEKRQGMTYIENNDTVKITTLDEYVNREKICDIAMIKVDIEGAEPLFLEGAKQTICNQKPILLISIYHNAHDFFELKPLIESWNLGYTFSVYKPVFENTTSETLLIAEVLQ